MNPCLPRVAAIVAASSLLLVVLPVNVALAAGAGVQAGASVRDELRMIQRDIDAKVARGARAESAFASELARLDTLALTHWDQNPEEVAEVLEAQAELYGGALANADLAIATLQRLKFSFAGTAAAGRADERIASLRAQARSVASGAPGPAMDAPPPAGNVTSGLNLGQRFPEFSVSSLDGQTLSLAGLRGRVVLINFWATWCGPCVAEIPNIERAYRNHHDDGFEVIGISLDEDHGVLQRFVQQRSLPWPQCLDAAEDDPLAQRYGIRAIPATFLLDREGIIIGRNLRGPALDRAVSKALSR